MILIIFFLTFFLILLIIKQNYIRKQLQLDLLFLNKHGYLNNKNYKKRYKTNKISKNSKLKTKNNIPYCSHNNNYIINASTNNDDINTKNYNYKIYIFENKIFDNINYKNNEFIFNKNIIKNK